MIKKIAVLTSGGDAPGMNAAVRVVIRTALYYGLETYVVYDGYRGLVDGNIVQVHKEFTQDIINRGGTIIGTARCPEFMDPKVVKRAARNLKDLDIDALVGIGGDGTFRGLKDLAEAGINVVGVPATIDNDVASSDETIGFSTALNTICECVDRIKDTSTSHQRCSLIEVMGHHCGDLALYSSIAEAAELVITHDHRLDDEEICKRLRRLRVQKKSHAVVVISEKLLDIRALAEKIKEDTGFEVKVEILGHLQRGGAPSAHDRILASLMGSKAVECLIQNQSKKIVCMYHNEVIVRDIDEALSMKHDSHEEMLKLVNILQ